MVIVVLVECVLAILLISVLGKAIETYQTEVECKEIYFTDANGEKIQINEVTGMAVMEVTLTDTKRSIQLTWNFSPTNTSNKSVTFVSSLPDWVEVDESGMVNFFDDRAAVITISTTNGKSASIQLIPKTDDGKEVGPLE